MDRVKLYLHRVKPYEKLLVCVSNYQNKFKVGVHFVRECANRWN